MERYISLFKNKMEYVMLEMSQTRKRAESRIISYMVPLLIHLIAVKEFGKKDVNHNHHIKEIEGFKKTIINANKKKNTNKTWFSYQFILDISKDYMVDAVVKFESKFDTIAKHEYESLDDFEDFKLY